MTCYHRTTLIQSDTVHPYGHVKGGTSPGGVGLRGKKKDLSEGEREKREFGEGVSTEDVRESPLCTYVYIFRRVRHHRTGWNLLMTGTDLLDDSTGTPPVSQWSES